jgi:hypothetical protein
LPATLTIKLLKLIVPVNPLGKKVCEVTFSPSVTVPPPDKELKIAASADVGADAPGAPPLVVDQLAVEVVFHVPVPPTQNLLAMNRHLKNIACEKTNSFYCVTTDFYDFTIIHVILTN